MKQVDIATFNQVYSFSQDDRPDYAWAIMVEHGDVPSVSQPIIEKAQDLSEYWTGWGFVDNTSYILFESRNDAIYARIAIREVDQ